MQNKIKVKEAAAQYLRPSQLRQMARERKESQGLTFAEIAEIVGRETGKTPSRQAVSQAFKEEGEGTKLLTIIVHFLHGSGTVFRYDKNSRPTPFFCIEINF